MIVRFADLAAGARRAARREAVVSRYASELLASSGRAALYAHAEQTATNARGRPAPPGRRARRGRGERLRVPRPDPGSRRGRRGPRRRRRPARAAPAGAPPRHGRRRALARARARGPARRRARGRPGRWPQQNEQLRELDRMKDQFVSTVSHELRTPLTAMVGYLEFVREGEAGELNETQARFLEIVQPQRRPAERPGGRHPRGRAHGRRTAHARTRAGRPRRAGRGRDRVERAPRRTSEGVELRFGRPTSRSCSPPTGGVWPRFSATYSPTRSSSRRKEGP